MHCTKGDILHEELIQLLLLDCINNLHGPLSEDDFLLLGRLFHMLALGQISKLTIRHTQTKS